jgi:hypothetical protein
MMILEKKSACRKDTCRRRIRVLSVRRSRARWILYGRVRSFCCWYANLCLVQRI